MGFFLYRNIEINIDDFVNLFNDKLETYFLNEKEKRILAKLVFSLRNYKEIIHSDKIYNCIDANVEYVVKQGKEINPQNPEDSYLLLKPIEDNKAVVIAGGTFNNVSPETMIDVFELIDEDVPVFAHHINTPNSYYVFTTIDGINMPRFAPICHFRYIFNKLDRNFKPRKSRQNTANRGILGRRNNMISILFVCHGSILKNPEKACKINGFKAREGACYTTIIPF